MQVHSIMYVRMHVLVSVAGPLSLYVSMYATLSVSMYVSPYLSISTSLSVSMYASLCMVRIGGGVALYIKQSIQAYEFQINNAVDYDEAIWCNILIRGAKLTVGVVYRCPSTSKEQYVILHNVISHVSINDCVIMGDFNHADIRWNSLDSCDDGKAFLMLVQDCFLTQHVSEPTRGDNILDLILSTQK